MIPALSEQILSLSIESNPEFKAKYLSKQFYHFQVSSQRLSFRKIESRDATQQDPDEALLGCREVKPTKNIGLFTSG